MKWYEPEKDYYPEFVPKHNKNIGPGTYNQQREDGPLYKYQPNAAFSSNTRMDTLNNGKIRNIQSMDMKTQMARLGNPGPGSYFQTINKNNTKMKSARNKMSNQNFTNSVAKDNQENLEDRGKPVNYNNWKPQGNGTFGLLCAKLKEFPLSNIGKNSL